MPNKTIMELYTAYRAELDKLVKINKKQDFTARGEREFHTQSHRVAVAKMRILTAEKANGNENVRSFSDTKR